ncbi:hypothetical protein LTR91_012700 [Friedmanniomyces endolithicus]|uniref:Uncharacterized protein n=1 Tax=Friedmanniomyces endolithicus TaxID=329885 RepID=A0AAN6KET7_9PEZI|nr:hypothetical protein LTR57_012113 [Friedmanniomyces endolithicus]KAK0979102.1 hypothetical protein LTR91_012700 [Friedmanniomyces endolithicus]KAK0991896.1 hypothetical protein LTS01_007985 [Friedmanniomyces endolithicus]KAK1047364.1 hypothetical protein LTS16_005134 [Friedmanniomyces endolithicus]
MPSATFTVSSGSERVIRVGRGVSSGGSASIHSPTSSSSRSTESWSDLGAGDEDEDDLVAPSASESASRSRATSSRRHTTEARPAPTRRHSSRRVIPEREEKSPPPRIRRRTTHTSTRHRRAESRRTPSDESGSVASYDEYHYGHPGPAPQPPRAHPPPSGYRHVPAPVPGGYPPSMTSAAPYGDPYAAQQQALVPLPHQDAFGYQPNPFTPQHQPNNPFSPISSVGGPSYFAMDPHAPPQLQHPPRPGVQRPQSFVAPSHYGAELAMSPYPYSGHPGLAHPALSPYGYPPAMSPWGYPPPTRSPAPPPDPEKEKFNAELEALKTAFAQKDKANNAAVATLKATLQSKDEAERVKATGEMENLRVLIKKYEEAQAAAEAAAVAKKAEEEAEKRKKQEIEAATKKTKEDVEKKAAEAALKTKAEHEKTLAELKAAQAEAEKKHKELEEEAAKHKPLPDTLQAPIKFKENCNPILLNSFHRSGPVSRISGITPTVPTYKNVPAVNGNNKSPHTRLVPANPTFPTPLTASAAALALFPPNSCTAIPIIVPSTAPKAVTNCSPMAAFLLMPPWMSSAKSPTSCGISWQKTARVVVAPMVGEA